ncbi:MAG: YdeI/OmpD-associated family protein [Pseudomonadota bacterium]|nr:YdeI/OmpD-associated family protein [Pseudomonadota bacterium]
MVNADHKGLLVVAFASRENWEAWLVENGAASPGIWLKFAKKTSGVASIDKPEAIETALAHGWIDGQLDRFDDQFWLVRFTPRGPKSKWSQINRDTATKLLADGRMAPAGLAEVEKARSDGRWDAAYAPQSRAEVPDDLQAALDAQPAAKAFFATLRGANRYAILYRVHDAKIAKTRAARIEKFVSMLALGQTIHPTKA